MPPGSHITAWQRQLDDLQYATSQIRYLTKLIPEEGDQVAQREQGKALWPFLVTWADYVPTLTALIDQYPSPPPTPTAPLGRDLRAWAELARAGRPHEALDVIDSHWDLNRRLITIARIYDPEDDDRESVLVLVGDLDGPEVSVLGVFADVDAAYQAAPRPAPAGVLRPNQPPARTVVRPPERSPRDLTDEILTTSYAESVGETLLDAADDRTYDPGPLAQIGQMLAASAEFADALDTQTGARLAERLRALQNQLAHLTEQVRTTGEELAFTLGVLPPHRIPPPRFTNLTPPAGARTSPLPPARPASPTSPHR